MAKLIKDDAQVQACNEINEMLEEIKLLNQRILSDDPIVIEVNKKQSVNIDNSFSDKILAILKSQRQKRVKDILYKSNKFRICLDESEQHLISDEAIASKNHSKESEPQFNNEEPEITSLFNDV